MDSVGRKRPPTADTAQRQPACGQQDQGGGLGYGGGIIGITYAREILRGEESIH